MSEILNNANGTTPAQIVVQKGTGGAAFASTRMPTEAFKSGTLANVTPFVVDMSGAPMPCAIVLATTYASRLIELSVDGGVNYFTPTYDVTSTPLISVTVRAPVTHARLTGQANDLWSIR